VENAIKGKFGGILLLRDKASDRTINKTSDKASDKTTLRDMVAEYSVNLMTIDRDARLLYSGLRQGQTLADQLDAIRCRPNCWGSLFRMYSDCWGEADWSIVDNQLKRKISYYFVKRAFAPVKLDIRERPEPTASNSGLTSNSGFTSNSRIHSNLGLYSNSCAPTGSGELIVTGINDTADDMEFECEYGYISLTGKMKYAKKAEICLKARSRSVILRFMKYGYEDPSKGFYFVRPLKRDDIHPVFLRECEFRKLDTPSANLKISGFTGKSDAISFKVSSNVYAHAVHFNLAGHIRLSDEYFDLLPGESRTVTIYDDIEKILIKDLRPHYIKNKTPSIVAG